jgi:hypothetical protein
MEGDPTVVMNVVPDDSPVFRIVERPDRQLGAV